MQIKVGDLDGSIRALNILVNSNLSAKVSFKLILLMQESEKILKSYSDSAMKLYQKYGDEKFDPQTNKPLGYEVPDEKLEEFKVEFEDLRNTLVTIPDVKISINDIENIKMSPANLARIMWLIQENDGTTG